MFITKLFRKYNHITNAVLFILSFLLPFINEKLPNDFKIPPIIIGIAIVVLLEIIITYENYSSKKEKELKEQINQKNARAKYILSQLNLLQEEKTNQLKNKTYYKDYTIQHNLLFYNVHQYMNRVCSNLRNVVSRLIYTDSEYVDVSLIYKYSNSTKWKWIAGKSGTSGAGNDLNDFVNDKTTLFNYIINNTNRSPIFCNDKNILINENHYHAGRRDRLFKNKGSVMAMALSYFNNEKELINAVLLISTYGVQFVRDDKKIDNFKQILIYEVLPYYVSLLQSEMGAMYLRHIYLENSIQVTTDKNSK